MKVVIGMQGKINKYILKSIEEEGERAGVRTPVLREIGGHVRMQDFLLQKVFLVQEKDE